MLRQYILISLTIIFICGPYLTSGQSPEEYNASGIVKYELKDFLGSIDDYTKAIEGNATFTEAYFNRGISRDEVGDHAGALADFTKVIELDSVNADAFFCRGLAKSNLKDFTGAIADYTRSIELSLPKRLGRRKTGF